MPTIPYGPIAAIIIAFAIAAVVVRLARTIIYRLLNRLDIVGVENREAVHARARQLQSALTFLAYGVAVVASLSIAMERFGVQGAEWDLHAAAHWGLTHGINAAIIIVGAFILVRVANLAIDHLQFKLARTKVSTDLEWQRRATTLGRILTSLVSAVVGFVAVLMLLRELSIDVMPILTGAGIAGLAVGFGAQNLVRDVISGFFLILEDQVRIGDVARINGTTGVVEQINLRTILVRDGEGAVHVFPNGTITALANLSKLFAYAVVDVKVAYNENLDRVLGTIREVGAAIEHDPTLSPLIQASIEILGITSLEGGAANIQVRFKTRPLNQGRIANELRRRLMTTFAARGIRPYT